MQQLSLIRLQSVDNDLGFALPRQAGDRLEQPCRVVGFDAELLHELRIALPPEPNCRL